MNEQYLQPDQTSHENQLVTTQKKKKKTTQHLLLTKSHA
jgi:hypothetical protein